MHRSLGCREVVEPPARVSVHIGEALRQLCHTLQQARQDQMLEAVLARQSDRQRCSDVPSVPKNRYCNLLRSLDGAPSLHLVIIALLVLLLSSLNMSPGAGTEAEAP